MSFCAVDLKWQDNKGVILIKARDIRNFFLDGAHWVNLEKTLDQFIAGDPDKDVSSVLVTLYGDYEAIRYAVENKFDMLITHEPVFGFNSHELESINSLDPDSVRFKNLTAKKKFIEDSNLVILRIHDVWDRMPEIGMLPAWLDFIGIKTPPVQTGRGGILGRFDIEPVRLDDLARSIAQKTASIGEPYVHVVGDGNKLVSKIGITIGCGGTIYHFVEMGCDVSIVTDDGTCYWSDVKFAKDNDHCVIYLNHGTTEEPGMVTMTKYLKDNFSQLKVEHYPHRCGIRVIR